MYKAWEIGAFTKFEGNPIISPSEKGFDSWTAYNSAVCVQDDIFYMFYRAETRDEQDTPYCGTSRIGLATSTDGFHFTKHSTEPLLDADQPYEQPAGLEDPRIVRFEGAWHMFYTAYNYPQVYVCRAVSKDLLHWEKLGPVFKAEYDRQQENKSCAIVTNPQLEPVKIDGRYLMYTNEFIAESEDFYHWQIKPFEAWRFAGRINEVCVALTDYQQPGEDDINLLIAGNLDEIMPDKDYFYAVCQSRYDRHAPAILKDYSAEATIFPETACERSVDRLFGDQPKKGTIFLCSLFAYNGKWWMYYGASDKYTCVATADYKG